MQELYHLIKVRFDKINLLNGTNITNEEYTRLREEQKSRCEKETWILSMFRSKKNLSPTQKQNYFTYSYAIMQVIQPSFKYQVEPLLTQETFLNDFVCLYTQFFDQYDNKFNFKVKVRNLLRPTNHNVVNDLIKYLSDFSRDYSQHMYFWQVKSSRKSITQASSSTHTDLSKSQPQQKDENEQERSQIPLDRKKMSKNKQSLSLKKASHSQVFQQNKRKVQGQQDPIKKQKQFNRIYGILQIQPQSVFVLSQKSKSSLDVLKLKINQMYRESKWRNNIVKKSLSQYYSTYSQTGSTLPKQSFSEQASNFPIKISLSVEKNGFSCLVISQNEQRISPTKQTRGLSPIKQKERKASSLSSKDAVNQPINSSYKGQNDFMLNSLKILRVSQNFLPPLVNNAGSTKNTQQSVRKQTIFIQNFHSNKPSNHQNMELKCEKDCEMLKKDGIIYYNQQLIRQAERKKAQKRRISQMRKHFISEQKMKQARKKMNEPQGKIVQWLDKINMMKQLQRKKILGLI